MILYIEIGKIEKFEIDVLEFMISLYLVNGNYIKVEYIFDFLFEISDGLSVANRLIGKFIREGEFYFFI